MLDDFSRTSRIKLQRDTGTSNANTAHLNLSLNSFSGSLAGRFPCSQSQSYNLSSDHLSPSTSTSNSNNNHNHDDNNQQSSGNSYKHQNQPNDHQILSQQHNSSDEQYFTSDETNSSTQNINITSAPSVNSSIGHQLKGADTNCSGGMLASAEQLGINRPTVMVPTSAHCSDQHNLHYSLSTSKPNPANMALNFSHDLLLHQGQSVLHHPNVGDGSDDHKPSQLELDSGNLMQSAAAANMNIWKNTMNINLKHDHSFLQTPDMNSFPSWTHGSNLQGPPNMTHHILDSQHLIGYQQHNQRSTLHLNNHDLVEASLKNQGRNAEHASFVLNPINHSVVTSQAPMSNQHTPHQSNDSPHLRTQSLEHGLGSYNLSMNDSQFYNHRSHSSTIKSTAFPHDRQVHISLVGGHQTSHIPYHNSEHINSQPTTSHHIAGGSSASSSKNIGTFRCPHCNEMFNMRNLYQSHLKTHSQEKGSKAKFHCELCGHSFSQKTSLNRHMKSHTGERPFPCEVCGKAFSEKERLKIHMRTHTGEKPFSCGVCGKSFSQKSTVKRHQTVHTGEKKFKCDCGKGFANRGNLIAHIKTRGAHHFE